jgi:hypothetical protein
MLQQVGDPLAILGVRLPPRDSFDMLSVHEQDREVLFENVPTGFQYTPVLSIATWVT